MKLFKFFLITVIVLFVIALTLAFFGIRPYKLEGDYYLLGKSTNSYVIQKGRFGKTLVSDMDRQCEWIITSSAIYGHKGDVSNLEDDYFYINKATDSVLYFQNLTELSDYLSSQGFNRYSMSDSENISHLKTGNRKFK